MLRTALPDDIPYIQSILNTPDNLGKLAGYGDDAIRAALDDPQQVVLIWQEPDDSAAAFVWVAVMKDGPKRGTKIEEFGVSRPGGGIGRKVMAALMAYVKDNSCPNPLWLAVAGDNDGAIRFYERFGFAETGRKAKVWHRREGEPADAVRMDYLP